MVDYNWTSHIRVEQHDAFFRFYTSEWWTKDRRREDVLHMLAHCDRLIVCHDADDEIVGFARVLTDYTFKAMIFDVIVSENLRGQGLGRLIIEQILGDPVLRRVKSFELYCPERLAGFYEKLGFVRGESKLLFNQPER